MRILFETPVSPKPAYPAYPACRRQAQPMRHAFPPSSSKTKSKRKALSLPTAGVAEALLFTLTDT